MIYVTGDCHGDFRRFNKKYFVEQLKMTKEDFVISESDEFKEKRDLRYKLEDELTEMLGGTQTLLYRKFDQYISAYADEMEVMREETYLLGAADREQMLK